MVTGAPGWAGRYLARLGLSDPGGPSAEALFAVHRAHTERIAYENIDIFRGRPQGISPAESIARILSGRGGYCYNLNGALATLLGALGYQVGWHAGAVHQAGAAPLPDEQRNHLAVTVVLDGQTWMVDAGLGDAHHEPLPLRAGSHRQGPFTFELAALPAVRGGWRFRHDPALNHSRPEMDFTLDPVHWTGFEARHASLSHGPRSPFVRICQLHRRDERGADSLIDCTLRRTEGDGQRSSRVLTGRADWFAAVAGVFGLRLDDLSAADKDALWQRVHASHQAWLAGQDRAQGS